MKLLTSALFLLFLGCLALEEEPVKYDKDNKPVLELPYGRFEAFSVRDGLYVDPSSDTVQRRRADVWQMDF
jgi:hypothetical protein